MEEQLDPRIQVELEKLNTATDEINKLEAKLEETNNAFSATFAESTARLKGMGKKLGGCIEKARPYYEAQELARTSQLECQRAAVQYQRANALHQAAKETIALAEERFVNSRHENWKFDSAWQEMLNHATMKVMEAEAQKAASEREHMYRAAVFQQAEQRVQQLQRGLKSSINKSLVYFEEKSRVEAQLESQKDRAQQLQSAITASKASYAKSLRSLEQISEQIHEQRRCQMPREPGVGAELTTPATGETPNYGGLQDKHFPTQEDLAQEEKYWESLREKLQKLPVSDAECVEAINGESLSLSSPEERERSMTNGSDSSSSSEGERVVSGQSSSVGSESDGGGSASVGAIQSPDGTIVLEGNQSHSTGEGGCNEESLAKGRSTPPGSCSEAMREEEGEGLGCTVTKDVTEDHPSKDTSDKAALLFKLPDKEDNPQLNDSAILMLPHDGDKSTQSSLKLNQGLGDFEESNCVRDVKEEGDGSSSPPPALCQPSKGLTVILEELEHCALPE